MNYNIYVYHKDKAKLLKYLYEELGNLKYVKEYIEDNGYVVNPTDDTINKFIKRYINTEIKDLNYNKWLRESRFRNTLILQKKE